MITIEQIRELTEEELGSLYGELSYNALLSSRQGANMSFAHFKKIAGKKDFELPISNTVFHILLNYITIINANSYLLYDTTNWFLHEHVKGILITSDDYVFALDNSQFDIFVELSESSDTTMPETHPVLLSALEADVPELTDEEYEMEFVKNMVTRQDMKSYVFSDVTSRFSGATWYERIKEKVVILAGLGGIGSYVAFLLSRMQPKAMFIYDDDIVEFANMSGQLYSANDVGMYKTEAMVKKISSYSKYDSVFAINERFTSSSEPADIMICGFDNMQSRKEFFKRWSQHVSSKDEDKRGGCLFIDGRLSAEYFQVFCLTGDDFSKISDYANNRLFDDREAEETVCSYKQTTYMANMIGSVIVNLFTNFVANEVANAPIRELPYLSTYDGNSMKFEIL